MRKTIKGHTYNTATSQFIAVATVEHVITALYRTKAGRYFLLHNGSLLAQDNDIEPIEPDEALAWYNKLTTQETKHDEQQP